MAASEYFYTNSDLVGKGDITDVQNSLGIEITVPAGSINAIRWWCPGVVPASVQARVYSDVGVLLASRPVFDTVNTNSWNLATIPGGLVVAAGTYRITVVTTNRAERPGFFPGRAPIARGALIFGGSRADLGDVFPTWPNPDGTYFVDVVFSPAAYSTKHSSGFMTIF